MLSFERQAWDSGIRRIAGVDEAGRGPLAGPVCGAAVILNFADLRDCPDRFKGITDSKRLTPRTREELYEVLTSSDLVEIGVALIDTDQIDRINILGATRLAMIESLGKLQPEADLALVDGRPIKDLHPNPRFIVKGDSKSLSIAAASIIAKVTRDRVMLEIDHEFPDYGFSRHKGYGTKEHMEALKRYGPCRHHRSSFRPVCDLLSPTLEL